MAEPANRAPIREASTLHFRVLRRGPDAVPQRQVFNVLNTYVNALDYKHRLASVEARIRLLDRQITAELQLLEAGRSTPAAAQLLEIETMTKASTSGNETIRISAPARGAECPGGLGRRRLCPYQLAEQRREIAALRAEQGARRLADPTLTAPVAGRIADLVPRSELGALMPVGTVVAEVESGQRLEAVLQLAASDGPHVRAGMGGSVVVRGLVDKSYPVRLLEGPLVQGREHGSSTLTVLAAIEADAQGELFKGLTGFARIEAGERPDGLVLVRPLTDYLGLMLWQYLGLRLSGRSGFASRSRATATSIS